jgi:hypothetical protein
LVITCPPQMPFSTAVGFKVELSQPLARIVSGSDLPHDN